MIFNDESEKFITGNEAVIEAALAAGAKMMCGYPITPATEILENWTKKTLDPKLKLKVIQSEDETSAGFNTIGGILAGEKVFTATAGVGHVLMQDPISMAEAMRLPFVGIIMQRGGPSTGTVIYGQQEVTMACYGGNGEGNRIVYSPNGPQELYDYTIKAFNNAWKYMFPAFVLGDGYQSKMRVKVKLNKPKVFLPRPIFPDTNLSTNIRNCYNFENQLQEVLIKDTLEYEKASREIVEYEEYLCKDAELVIFAHGIVAAAAKTAVEMLRVNKKKVGLFRPVTLRPFPTDAASRIAASAGKILIAESSFGHFTRLVKGNIYGLSRIELLLNPVMEITPEKIIDKINKMNDNFWTEH